MGYTRTSCYGGASLIKHIYFYCQICEQPSLASIFGDTAGEEVGDTDTSATPALLMAKAGEPAVAAVAKTRVSFIPFIFIIGLDPCLGHLIGAIGQRERDEKGARDSHANIGEQSWQDAGPDLHLPLLSLHRLSRNVRLGQDQANQAEYSPHFHQATFWRPEM